MASQYHSDDELTVIGRTNFHNENKKFGIKLDDRRRHMYIMGKTGMGKTSLLLNMAVSDIQKGHGMAFVDPHGDVAESLLHYIPEDRVEDVIYFNPADLEYPIGFNPLDDVRPEERHLVTDGLIGVFQKIWADSWGPRLAYILRNCILTLLEYPDTTLLDIMRILVDKNWRSQVVRHIQDPVVKSFWINEFNNYTEQMMREAISPIQNKVGQFTSSPLIRNIIGQKKSTFDLREIMDNRKILLLNLSKGAVGEGGSQLIGAMMITKMQLAAMSRVDMPEKDRVDFFAYIDEFQNFSTDSFAEILSEARKYRLGLILAHQYIHQLSENVQAAVFGNVGTTILFRIGGHDSEVMEKEFGPRLTAQDLVNLPKWKIYVKLMIDGATSQPFSANTIPDPEPPENDLSQHVIEYSRTHYGTHRDFVGTSKADEDVEEQEQQSQTDSSRSGSSQSSSHQGHGRTHKQHAQNSQKSRSQSNQKQRHKRNQSERSSRSSKDTQQRQHTEQSAKTSEKQAVQTSPNEEPQTESQQSEEPSSDQHTVPSTEEERVEQEQASTEPSHESKDVSQSDAEPASESEHSDVADTRQQASQEDTTQQEQNTEQSTETSSDTEEGEEIYNPLLAKKIKEMYAKSTTPLGETEYLLKAQVQEQINEPPENRFSYDELLEQLLLEIKPDLDWESLEEMAKKAETEPEESQEQESSEHPPEQHSKNQNRKSKKHKKTSKQSERRTEKHDPNEQTPHTSQEEQNASDAQPQSEQPPQSETGDDTSHTEEHSTPDLSAEEPVSDTTDNSEEPISQDNITQEETTDKAEASSLQVEEEPLDNPQKEEQSPSQVEKQQISHISRSQSQKRVIKPGQVIKFKK